LFLFFVFIFFCISWPLTFENVSIGSCRREHVAAVIKIICCAGQKLANFGGNQILLSWSQLWKKWKYSTHSWPKKEGWIRRGRQGANCPKKWPRKWVRGGLFGGIVASDLGSTTQFYFATFGGQLNGLGWVQGSVKEMYIEKIAYLELVYQFSQNSTY